MTTPAMRVLKVAYPHCCLTLMTSPSDRRYVHQLLAELGINLHQPWVVIHPGATAPSHRYPPESFAIVARRL